MANLSRVLPHGVPPPTVFTPAPLAVQARGTQPGTPFLWDGSLRARSSANQPDVYSGVGAPTASFPDPNPRQGALYLRKDGGGAGATHIYYFNAGAWLGIA